MNRMMNRKAKRMTKRVMKRMMRRRDNIKSRKEAVSREESICYGKVCDTIEYFSPQLQFAECILALILASVYFVSVSLSYCRSSTMLSLGHLILVLMPEWWKKLTRNPDKATWPE